MWMVLYQVSNLIEHCCTILLCYLEGEIYDDVVDRDENLIQNDLNSQLQYQDGR